MYGGPTKSENINVFGMRRGGEFAEGVARVITLADEASVTNTSASWLLPDLARAFAKESQNAQRAHGSLQGDLRG